MFSAELDGLGWCGDGPDIVGNGWDHYCYYYYYYYHFPLSKTRMHGVGCGPRSWRRPAAGGGGWRQPAAAGGGRRPGSQRPAGGRRQLAAAAGGQQPAAGGRGGGQGHLLALAPWGLPRRSPTPA